MTLFHDQIKKIPEDIRPDVNNFFRKLATSLPPYNFIVNYAQIMMSNQEKTTEANFGRDFAQLLYSETSKDINDKIRIVELAKDLIKIVESTDNNIFFRPLFFPVIFINNEFHFENLIFKGIAVTECFSQEIDGLPLSYALHASPEINNDYAIFAVCIDLEQCCEYYLNIVLINKSPGFKFTDNAEEDKMLDRAGEFLRNIVCNVVDMVDKMNKELDITYIITTNEKNLKRGKRGKFPIPTKVYIRPKGEFKKYVSEFNGNSTKLGHKVLVRGFWRHYRDDRYVKVKGTKQWIKPHYRGEGILIRKDYKIVGE